MKNTTVYVMLGENESFLLQILLSIHDISLCALWRKVACGQRIIPMLTYFFSSF